LAVPLLGVPSHNHQEEEAVLLSEAAVVELPQPCKGAPVVVAQVEEAVETLKCNNLLGSSSSSMVSGQGEDRPPLVGHRILEAVCRVWVVLKINRWDTPVSKQAEEEDRQEEVGSLIFRRTILSKTISLNNKLQMRAGSNMGRGLKGEDMGEVFLQVSVVQDFLKVEILAKVSQIKVMLP
jgi:hypothetical protein